MIEQLKRQAASMALAQIRPGMRLGLGTGSTARHFVDLLGEQVAAGFDCLCVPTSEATAAQATALNIPLSDLDRLDRLDVTVDGADEIDVCAAHGCAGELRLRQGQSGQAFVTDGGHVILDASFGRISQPEALSADLLDIAGVVQHGLFLKMCKTAYVAAPDGVRTLSSDK